jgi:hypothetical protein
MRRPPDLDHSEISLRLQGTQAQGTQAQGTQAQGA